MALHNAIGAFDKTGLMEIVAPGRVHAMFTPTIGGSYVPTDYLWQAPAAALVLGYLLGSIPFGVLLTRLAGAGDLRQIGSGNIGATNVLRTGNKTLAALTLLLDLAKGFAACLIGAIWGADAMLAAAGAVILGHMFPVWLGFRGGKAG